MKKPLFVCALTFLLLILTPSASATSYLETNLVSDLSTVGAQTVDSNLKNPWGLAFSATSPFWVSNQGTSTATLYNGAGVKSALTVTVPPTAPPPAGPTGQVFNSAGTGNFVVNGTAASFIFDTLSGTIDAWNNVPTGNSTATVMVTSAGAVYTGLTLANNGLANYLYAANFTNGGGINVFDSTFNSVTNTTFSGKFVDPALPAGYAPYNIQVVGSTLYVEYAEVGVGGAVTGAGLGYVDAFDLNGNFLMRVVSNGPLNAPWGVTLAPSTFGQFGGDLLIGNFGDGTINAFNPTTGAPLGTLRDANGNPIAISGLWALAFRPNGGASSVANGLYFTAGIDGQADGLFGYLTPTPEPSSYGLGALGLLTLAVVAFTHRKTNGKIAR